MNGDGQTDPPALEDTQRRTRAALAGHSGDEATARALFSDAAPRVRAAALGALSRMGRATADDVAAALGDADPLLRRRACAVAVGVDEVDLIPLLADPDPLVVEAAAWALGERARAGAGVVKALAAVARASPDALCREAAVAALGSIGDAAGLPSILAATRDKPAVRRRAVLALAPFEGPDVEASLQRALQDRDWQVRQAAEDLLADGGSG